MKLKESDQLHLLETVAKAEETGKFEGIFTYPGCAHDLVKEGLVTEDGKLTIAGKTVLWLLEKGPDPFPESRSSFTFELKPKSIV